MFSTDQLHNIFFPNNIKIPSILNVQASTFVSQNFSISHLFLPKNHYFSRIKPIIVIFILN